MSDPDNSPASGMNSSTRVRWYRSLYWRIALGLFAFLALMLTAQGALFLWMTDRIAGSMPARSPRRLAALVASDVSAAINANPNLDLQTYLPEQYGETASEAEGHAVSVMRAWLSN